MRFPRLALTLATFLLLGTTHARADDFALKPGDRVVFYGDSITDQRLYTTFVESFVVTRFPGLDVRFVHSGWGGDRVTGGGGGPVDERIDRDVLAYKPTVVTCMLGMNDAGVRAFDEKLFETYGKGLRHIVERVKAGAPDARITLIEPSPYDDVTRPPGFPGGYNEVLRRYGSFVRVLAGELKTDVADLNSAVVSLLRRANERDPKLAQKIIPDRVHPAAAGQLVMARALLGAWHAPAVVSSVAIDAASGKVERSDNAQVSDLKGSTALSWTTLEGSLPLAWDAPKDSPLALAVECSDVLEALDQETLRVTGLASDDYVLKVDGARVATLSRERLAEGVNLAALATPMRAQALGVHALTLRHNDVHFSRWRHVQVPFAKDALASMPHALEALDALEEDVVRLQRERAKPVPHRFELVPQL